MSRSLVEVIADFQGYLQRQAFTGGFVQREELVLLLEAAGRALADEKLLDGQHAVGFRDGARCMADRTQAEVDRLKAELLAAHSHKHAATDPLRLAHADIAALEAELKGAREALGILPIKGRLVDAINNVSIRCAIAEKEVKNVLLEREQIVLEHNETLARLAATEENLAVAQQQRHQERVRAVLAEDLRDEFKPQVDAAREALGDFVNAPFSGSIVDGINMISARLLAAERHCKELQASVALHESGTALQTLTRTTAELHVQHDRLKAELDLVNQTGTLAIEALKLYANPEFYHGCSLTFDKLAGRFADDFSEDYDNDRYDQPMAGKLARETWATIRTMFVEGRKS